MVAPTAASLERLEGMDWVSDETKVAAAERVGAMIVTGPLSVDPYTVDLIVTKGYYEYVETTSHTLPAHGLPPNAQVHPPQLPVEHPLRRDGKNVGPRADARIQQRA